jgi:hypothetical protein
MGTLAPPAPATKSAAQIFAENGYTSARILELAGRRPRNRTLVLALAGELAELEAAS